VTSGTSGERPLVSVVVPTMNSARVLEGALSSLSIQRFRDFEVILSDGSSVDDTLAMAERHVASLPSLRIDSRPDAGVYDAINRGVELARGEWFIVLGSDDCLHAADTLAVVAPHLRAESSAVMVYGDVRMMATNPCGVAPGGRYAGPMSMQRLFSTNICQQAIFYRRELYDTLGGFDTRYRIFADWDFNLRAAFMAPIRWIDVVVADYSATGMSSTAQEPKFYEELPGFIRNHLLLYPTRRDLWPAQWRVVRDANRMRRRGQWREAFSALGVYFRLLGRRIPVLLKRD
jgi:glycosyltransferase involved in cell wall biosynthesis